MFAVAFKTLQQLTTVQRIMTRSLASASEKAWKVNLSGTYRICAGFFLDNNSQCRNVGLHVLHAIERPIL